MKFDAVLFDCDGVLVDSEGLTNAVLRDALQERGWTLSSEECMALFVGKTVREERAAIEAHTGKPFSQDWLEDFYQRRNRALVASLEIVPGAREAVAAAQAHAALGIACASGADRFKVEMQLTKVGLMSFFEGHVFSGHEMPRSKPAPDVYLAAARHLNAQPQRCLVIEDSVAGITAGVAAGATVWAYCPPGRPPIGRAAAPSRCASPVCEHGRPAGLARRLNPALPLWQASPARPRQCWLCGACPGCSPQSCPQKLCMVLVRCVPCPRRARWEKSNVTCAQISPFDFSERSVNACFYVS